MSNIILNAEVRVDEGKGASRRLRRTGKTPAVVYGAGDPASVCILHKELQKAQENEAFYSSVINLNIGGDTSTVILKDIQRHPSKPFIMHADFQRVDDKTEVVMNVPLHFINEKSCPGVKLEGGIVQHMQTTLKVRCIATKLPEYIEVDLGKAVSGDIIHISDLTLPEGCESYDLMLGEDHDLAVAQIISAKGIAAAAEAADEAAEAGDAEDTGEEGEGEEEGDTEE